MTFLKSKKIAVILDSDSIWYPHLIILLTLKQKKADSKELAFLSFKQAKIAFLISYELASYCCFIPCFSGDPY
jgi:hypothetical protein